MTATGLPNPSELERMSLTERLSNCTFGASHASSSRISYLWRRNMTNVRRVAAGVVLVCLMGSQSTGPLFAQEQQSIPVETVAALPIADTLLAPPEVPSAGTAVATPRDETAASTTAPPSLKLSAETFAMTARLDPHAPAWLTTPVFAPAEFGAMTQRGYYGGGRGRNGAARAEIVLGAIATIAGTAVLVYANRPDCSTSPTASGCGYGTKVVGTAVLSAGLVGLIVGALTWR
jgi:hypothetical protein